MATKSEFQWMGFTKFGGGMNSAEPANQIEDDELASILNFEFDSSDHLKARNGFMRQNTSPDFTNRITSIFNFITAASAENIIVTTGTEIYKNTAGVYTSIKGAVALPNNTYWQWRAFNNLAIAANQQSGGAEKGLIKWTGAGNVAALGLTGISGAVDGAYTIEVFNNRLWIVFDAFPNRLYFSNLGDPENYAAGGFIEIGYNDGDRIQGIHAHNGRMFIFKRFKIYILTTSLGGKSNTDPTGWNVDLKVKDVGCVSRYTIQSLLDDIVFLSDEGILSLKALENYDSYFTVAISRKIKELTNINFSVDTFSSVIFSPKSLYILSLPKTATGTTNNRMYVLDYKYVKENRIRWTVFESRTVNPAVLAVVLVNRKKTLFLGGDTPLFTISKWDDTTIFDDNNQIVDKAFLSKAFNFDKSLERKEYNQIALGVNFTLSNLSATLEFRLNEDDRAKTSFGVNISNTTLGGVWGTATWDVDVFASGITNAQIVHYKLKGSKGNRGRSGQLRFENSQLNQDITITDIGFQVGLLDLENA